jgi:HAD superfamily 5'-nucleotidase-like hydrolase
MGAMTDSDLQTSAGTPLAPSRADLLDMLERSRLVAPLDPRRAVFTNRNLNLSGVKFIGFDMDYTLAIYRKGEIEKLAFRLTVDKLIQNHSYPKEIGEVAYEPDRVIRGLVVDKVRGNIIKMDRYGHVGRAWHGSRTLTKDERRALYRTEKINLHSGAFAWVDTLFSLPEVCLYSQLVEWFDAHGGDASPTYHQLYDDIRAAIDEAHADGSLKSIIRQDPGLFIEKDRDLARTLHRFRSAGKRLFLMTNSYWSYSDTVMQYLLDGELEGYPSWRSYFDTVIVGAKKPAFFVSRSPFLEVDDETGSVATEGATVLSKGRVYQGGNLRDFQDLAGLGGEHVLYVGAPDFTRVEQLEEEMLRLDHEVNYYKLLTSEATRLRTSRNGAPGDGAAAPTPHDEELEEAERAARRALDQLRGQLRALKREKRDIERRVGDSANGYWAHLFREGVEASLFARQIEEYACIYTGRVSNLLNYSPIQYFRSPPAALPHERT